MKIFNRIKTWFFGASFVREQNIAIDKCEADMLVEAYEKKVLSPRLRTVGRERLKGFSFSREDLEIALYGKTLNLSDIKPKRGIHIAIGYRKQENKKALKGLTLILYGILNEAKPDGSTLHEKDKEIFDYALPCPKKCPRKEVITFPKRIIDGSLKP